MIVTRELRTYTCSIFEAVFLSDLDAACYVVKHMAFNARGIAYGSEERGPLIFRSRANERFSVPGELIVPRAIRQFGVSNGSRKTTCARRERSPRAIGFHMRAQVDRNVTAAPVKFRAEIPKLFHRREMYRCD